MSWLFGVGGKPPPEIPQLPVGLPPGGSEGGGSGGSDKPGDNKGKSRSDAYSFDSAALERAAKAAKELEKSSKCLISESSLF